MTDIEEKRYLIRYELESKIMDAISKINSDSSTTGKQIIGDWIHEEDGDIALDRLTTLIIH